jgi:CBS domain-containing protein
MMLREVMTANVRTIESAASIRQAAMMMRDIDVGMLPVLDAGKLVGTLTDRDITVRATEESRDPEGTPVSEIMTRDVVSAYEDEDASTAVSTMEQKQVRRLLVLDHADNCVGVVSLGDVALRSGEPELAEELLEEVSRPSA